MARLFFSARMPSVFVEYELKLVNGRCPISLQNNDPAQITQLLHAWQEGDEYALDQLIPLVYQELHVIARCRIREERQGHTLQPTSLINEFYLRYAPEKHQAFYSRAHFFGIAANIMRQVLIDHARKKNAAYRGGDVQKESFDEMQIPGETGRLENIELLALDQALSHLEEMDKEQARIVEMRFFAGLTFAEIATILDVTERTIMRKWATARVWLLKALQSEST